MAGLFGIPHRRIGLLGGSFNPAHGGHLHISRLALTRLDLDEVWWLVSPQNPLKPAAGMASFAERLAGATAVAKAEPRIKVNGIEAALGTTYTCDTIATLQRRFPRTRFVFLLGADNLVQLPRWRRWEEIVARIPLAVFDRPQTALAALAGKAALRFARARVPASAARALAEMEPPAWAFFHTRLDPRSATAIRQRPAQPPRKPKETATVTQLSTRRRKPSAAATGADTDATPAVALPARRRRKAAAAPPAPALLELILKTLDDGKAEDIVTIDLAGKTLIADYMVIASGRSARQVTALTDHLLDALPKRMRASVEGKTQGDWVLVDAGDVIVHIFRPEIRAHYNLEKMWGSAFPEPEAARQ
jgi:nicotinate (nicotinamide) nucleotide adenylyltransferase/ribosome silencing factor RsfS/YbeB/iojap